MSKREEANPKEWRLNRTGYYIITERGESIIAEAPAGTEKSPEKYKKWLENAEIICRLYNGALSLLENEHE